MFLALLLAAAAPAGPYLAEGSKAGEITDRSAVIWTRLSARPRPNPGRYVAEPVQRGVAVLPPGKAAAELPGAVPGMAGRVRLRCDGRTTAWAEVTAATDFTHQFNLDGLKPAQRYEYELETSGGARHRGAFRTAPEPGAAAGVRFTVVTGLMYRHLDDPEGYRSFAAMRKNPPDFLVYTGDNVYYDNEPPRATTAEVARYHWQRMFSLPRLVELNAAIGTYWEKDDHDTLYNDVWPTLHPKAMLPFTFEEGQRIFLQQAPVGGNLSRTFRWGRHLQIWLPEGRDFRSPNNAPDGPGKTILGAEQKRWLKSSVEASDARYRIIVNQTPWVGPDRGNKGDNYANKAFATEGAEMRAWAAGLKNIYVITGDRHWQYHSVDPKTGLHEFSCGPASNEHAAGSPGEDKTYHRFHKVQGGYAWVEIGADGSAVFELRDVEGRTAYSWKAPAAAAPNR
ncbi:MAG: alkaline phosphatase [Bryobacteraceae bacterium]